jgi:predicted small secreted protein
MNTYKTYAFGKEAVIKQISVYLLIASVLVLAGCETTQGLGKDVENTGQNIQETVEKNK